MLGCVTPQFCFIFFPPSGRYGVESAAIFLASTSTLALLHPVQYAGQFGWYYVCTAVQRAYIKHAPAREEKNRDRNVYGIPVVPIVVALLLPLQHCRRRWFRAQTAFLHRPFRSTQVAFRRRLNLSLRVTDNTFRRSRYRCALAWFLLLLLHRGFCPVRSFSSLGSAEKA